MRLEKLTLSYVPTEDRIRLDGQTPQGEVVLLWLTQRLGNRLIPVLSDWLHKQVTSHHYAYYHEIQQFEQQKAQQARTVESAVNTDVVAHQWLVHAVDVGYNDQQMQLRFKGEHETERAELRLSNQDMRQWFEILYRMYRQADWQSPDWPVWMSHTSASSEAHLLH